MFFSYCLQVSGDNKKCVVLPCVERTITLKDSTDNIEEFQTLFLEKGP